MGELFGEVLSKVGHLHVQLCMGELVEIHSTVLRSDFQVEITRAGKFQNSKKFGFKVRTGRGSFGEDLSKIDFYCPPMYWAPTESHSHTHRYSTNMFNVE